MRMFSIRKYTTFAVVWSLSCSKQVSLSQVINSLIIHETGVTDWLSQWSIRLDLGVMSSSPMLGVEII